MRGLRLFSTAGFLATVLAANFALAQTSNNGSSNSSGNSSGNSSSNQSSGSLANAPAGVLISPSGVLTLKPFRDTTGELTRTRINESRARLGAVAKGSPLRKISLQRLEAAVAEMLA